MGKIIQGVVAPLTLKGDDRMKAFFNPAALKDDPPDPAPLAPPAPEAPVPEAPVVAKTQSSVDPTRKKRRSNLSAAVGLNL